MTLTCFASLSLLGIVGETGPRKVPSSSILTAPFPSARPHDSPPVNKEGSQYVSFQNVTSELKAAHALEYDGGAHTKAHKGLTGCCLPVSPTPRRLRLESPGSGIHSKTLSRNKTKRKKEWKQTDAGFLVVNRGEKPGSSKGFVPAAVSTRNTQLKQERLLLLVLANQTGRVPGELSPEVGWCH